jgi:DNA-binding NarL/FixJ family response regulator
VRTVVAAGAATRHALRAGLELIAEGDTARGLVADAVRAGADACILDIAPGDREWAIRTLRTALPDTVIVLVEPDAADPDIAAALAAGASAFVTTPAAAPHAVTLALQGHAVVPTPTVAGLARRARWAQPAAPAEDTEDLTAREREVLDALRDGATTAEIATVLGVSAVTVRRHLSGLRRKAGGSLMTAPTDRDRTALTARELQVLRLAAAGRGNQAIADELFITASTVKNHLTRIMAKLGARNRTEAAVLAARQGDL